MSGMSGGAGNNQAGFSSLKTAFLQILMLLHPLDLEIHYWFVKKLLIAALTKNMCSMQAKHSVPLSLVFHIPPFLCFMAAWLNHLLRRISLLLLLFFLQFTSFDKFLGNKSPLIRVLEFCLEMILYFRNTICWHRWEDNTTLSLPNPPVLIDIFKKKRTKKQED